MTAGSEVWYVVCMQSPSPCAARRPLVIVNPRAGRGRTGRDLSHVLEALRAAVGPVDVAPTASAGAASGLAEAAAVERRPLVVSVGGDGTLSDVADGVMRARRRLATGGVGAATAGFLPALGLVATGTGADFGHTLGIAPGVRACLAAIAGGAEREVDVGVARFTALDGRPVERFWINVLSAGVGGLVDRFAAAAPRFVGGRVAYAQAALHGIVVCRRVRLRCLVELPDGSHGERVLYSYAVAVCNGTTFGGGMRIAPMARPDDGLLEVVAFETRTRWRLVGRFLTVYAGTHIQEPGVSHFSCRALTMEPAEPPARRPRGGLFPLDVDGEALGDVPVAVELVARALRVRVPRR